MNLRRTDPIPSQSSLLPSLATHQRRKRQNWYHLQSTFKTSPFRFQRNTSFCCIWAASTIILAAGWTTSISSTMVEVSLVTKSLSMLLITSLSMPTEKGWDQSARKTKGQSQGSIKNTIWTQRCSVNRSKFLTSIDILQHSLLQSGQVAIAILEKASHTRTCIILNWRINHGRLRATMAYLHSTLLTIDGEYK